MINCPFRIKKFNIHLAVKSMRLTKQYPLIFKNMVRINPRTPINSRSCHIKWKKTIKIYLTLTENKI